MRLLIIFAPVCVTLAVRAQATVTTYGNFPDIWKQAINHDYTFVGFTGWPNFTPLSNQYSDLGLTFPDGNVWSHSTTSFYSDNAGLWIQSFPAAETTLAFAQDQYSFAMDYIADIQISLYYNNAHVFSYIVGASEFRFTGLVSTEPFNRVILTRGNFHTLNIDNLYFGPPIPAPGAFALFGLSALMLRRRRRL